ncbi:MAG TPA: DUF3108 domain-containing protein [Candidatus Alistipes avicola]|uniref:DUF3108 domain-containing protein n=1 Tax=Candidatus Alistipes avicola TaxID=2838432 RepID=A0A9D2L402_9BACT|nr:DUF3108 domain-containing protein [uncultured Alistipes sp.]HJA98849.1 DUF3108 domain-containing protein [Candidatus Alistipes avicola]
MRHRIGSLALLLFGVLSAGISRAQLYQPGEVLDYRISYRAKLVPNTEMGSARISTSLVTYQGETFYQVVGNGKTLPAFRWFMPVDDTYTIQADMQGKKTRYFESDIREGSYTFRSHYHYDWPAMQVHTRWKSRRMEQESRKTIKLTSGSMDPVSLYFLLRTMDISTLKVNEPHLLEMLLEDTIRRLQYRFLGREEKKIRKMGTFRTLKFACQLGTSEGFTFTDGTEFIIWISDDRNLIPLYIESPIRVGSIQAYISHYEGLKYPLDSKIK